MTQARTCRRCHKPTEVCECGDALGIAEREYGLLPMSLSTNSADTPLGLGGYDRPVERCENSDEIVRRYSEVAQPKIFCAYCDASIQTRALDEALRWFRTHPCEGEGETWQLPRGATG